MWRIVKKLIPNLTRRKIFLSKPCFLEKLLHSNHAFWKKFSCKIMLFKSARNTQSMRIYGVNWTKTWFFMCKIFFQVCFLKLVSSKSCFLKKNFFLKIWRVVSKDLTVKIVVGNVWQPTLGRCCVGVSFFPSLTQKHWRKHRILTKERFLLFSQRCILRSTADLTLFMLHRLLSVTTVKIVRCHFAKPNTLRDELTCGRFQLYIWQLKL